METILIPLLICFIGAFITIRYKEVSKKRENFDKEFLAFKNSFSDFINGLQSSNGSLNYHLLTQFKGHKIAKEAFVHNLKGRRLKRFNDKWLEYENQYNQVNNLGIFGIGASIAPSLDALQGASHNDPSNWESERKIKVHRIISELLEIAKVKIWL